MDKTKPMIVCMRVEDLEEAYVDSFKLKCSKCGKEVWISKIYKKYIKGLTPICIKCLEVLLCDSVSLC